MLKPTKYLLLSCLTIWTTCVNASHFRDGEEHAQMERLTAFGFRTGEEHAQLETLASFGRFPLPLRERAILTELDLMEKVYAGSDKANPDLQAVLSKFRDVYQTPSRFNEALERTVYDNGPMAGHKLLMEFCYVLMDYESLRVPAEYYPEGLVYTHPYIHLSSSSDFNLLWTYYSDLFKAAGIRKHILKDSLIDDCLKAEGDEILSVIKHLFEPDRYMRFEGFLDSGREYLDEKKSERQLKENPIFVEGGGAVIINTQDIKSILPMIPAQIDSIKATLHFLECKKKLDDKAAVLLLSNLSPADRMCGLKLHLDNPSNETLQAVIRFMTGRKALKDITIFFSEHCRLDPSRYKSIKALDKLISELTPEDME